MTRLSDCPTFCKVHPDIDQDLGLLALDRNTELFLDISGSMSGVQKYISVLTRKLLEYGVLAPTTYLFDTTVYAIPTIALTGYLPCLGGGTSFDFLFEFIVSDADRRRRLLSEAPTRAHTTVTTPVLDLCYESTQSVLIVTDGQDRISESLAKGIAPILAHRKVYFLHVNTCNCSPENAMKETLMVTKHINSIFNYNIMCFGVTPGKPMQRAIEPSHFKDAVSTKHEGWVMKITRSNCTLCDEFKEGRHYCRAGTVICDKCVKGLPELILNVGSGGAGQ